ncbi:hypothetical protein FRB96_005830 [Tulasnella sp. 330]|nr:hypothetical protein FRB96_005830 [Tulasnella sp. 330]KAG8888624.1 hypothetical protein FRB98_007297 [Tulasnella sp. 332]
MQFTSSIVALLAATSAAFVSAATFNVTVGDGGELAFNPNQVTAAPGDIVNFEFHPINHTLTQSTFATPCSPMAGGVDSGFQPVSATDTSFPVFSFQVMQATPLWFFCAQTGHCAKGMVFALNVNASSPNTFAKFQSNAMGGAAAATTAAVAGSGYGSSSSGSAAPASTSGATGGSAATSANGVGESKVVSAGLSVLALALAAVTLL